MSEGADTPPAPTIGFVLLTHREPAQTLRLIGRLGRSFGDPPIVLHHDFDQCPLPVPDLPANVRVMRPHLPTGWGSFGTTEAVLAALGLLMRPPVAPDWVVVLSGSDYPIKRAADVRAELAGSGADAFMDLPLVDPRTLPPRDGPTTVGEVSAAWLWTAFDRWFGRDLSLPFLDRKLRPHRPTVRLRSRRLAWTHGPFRRGFHCYGGEGHDHDEPALCRVQPGLSCAPSRARASPSPPTERRRGLFPFDRRQCAGAHGDERFATLHRLVSPRGRASEDADRRRPSPASPVPGALRAQVRSGRRCKRARPARCARRLRPGK